MDNKKTVVSCVLATLAGVCFVTGISLLAYEGSAVEHGAYEKTIVNS